MKMMYRLILIIGLPCYDVDIKQLGCAFSLTESSANLILHLVRKRQDPGTL